MVAPAEIPQPFESVIDAAPEPVTVEKRRPRRLRLWGGLLAVSILGIGGIVAIASRPDSEAPEVAALPVTVTTLEPVTSYQVSRSYTGEVVAGRSSQLGFERAGTLAALLVDQGDRVEAGQPLARLDIRSLEAQRQQLLAQKAQAQAQLQELQRGPRSEDIAAAQAAVADLEQQLALAQLQRSRREDLYARGAIAREELDQQSFGTAALSSRLDQAKSQLEALQTGTRPEQIAAQAAQVQQIDASLQALAVDIDKSVIRAPFAARVNQRRLDEGTVVASGQAVLDLIETGSLEAQVGVPTEMAEGLRVGDRLAIDIDGSPYQATLTALLPELDPTSRTVTAVLILPSEVSPVVGQTVRLSVAETQSADGFWLPSTALTPAAEGLWSVYVIQPTDSGYTVARRDVEILHTDGERSLVRGTVQVGDRAVISGTQRVVPGQAVVPGSS
ncbi:efflux transporter periplasmic adaptor subunit [filamentous cyanobacterium CCP5]|nr:efflux transporter periplasmic adaptor subunit [filamentous cyanobacterium CCP5]